MRKGDSQVICALTANSKPWEKEGCSSHLGTHSDTVSHLNSF